MAPSALHPLRASGLVLLIDPTGRMLLLSLPAVLAAMWPGGAGWTIPPIEVGV